MTTTTLKHLYRQMQRATGPQVHAALLAHISMSCRIPPSTLVGLPVDKLVLMLEDLGHKEASMSVISWNAYKAWHEFGCQTFSLDEKTVDMLACTASPDLNDLIGLDINNTNIEIEAAMLWQLPYPCFAVELPYPTSVLNEGKDELFTCAIAMPFGERVSKASGWSLVYLTMDDVAHQQTSVANSTSAINSLLTNLCVFLNDGGEKAKAKKRIGYEKIAKKARTKVNIWNVRTPSKTEIPLGIARSFIESGKVPPKTFRIGSRFMVRGHWRMQCCGKGLSEIKRTWVRPYVKGPEEGEAFSRVYKVKG